MPSFLKKSGISTEKFAIVQGLGVMGISRNILIFLSAVATGCSASSAQRSPSSNDTSPNRVGSGGSEPADSSTPTQNKPDAQATAAAAEQPPDKLRSGGAIYTAQQPGIYADLVSTHLGIPTLSSGRLKVVIDHEQVKGSYIHWVQLRTLAGDILWEKEYAEPEAAAVSTKFAPVEIDVSGMQLKSQQILYFYSSCGQHGIWRAEFKVP